jgi:hypothetical protein
MSDLQRQTTQAGAPRPMATYQFSPRPYALETAPELPRGLTSLMVPGERDILYSIAKNYCTGQGDIIDAGVYWGASTYCFCHGLVRNTADTSNLRIHSYDQAIVHPGLLKAFPDIGEIGSCYGPLLERSIREWGTRLTQPVDLHIGDINAMTYEGKVEVLFLDIMKNRATMRSCNSLFMRHLLPGRSIVIQQDYYWQSNWYINAYMELARDCFSIIDSSDTSCVFLNTRKIPPALMTDDPLAGLSSDDIVNLLDCSTRSAVTLFQYLMMHLCVIDYAVTARLAPLAKERFKAFADHYGDALREHRDQSIARVRAGHARLQRAVGLL